MSFKGFSSKNQAIALAAILQTAYSLASSLRIENESKKWFPRYPNICIDKNLLHN